MDPVDLRTLADAVGGQVWGEATGIRAASIDSRECGPSDVFFALRGSHHDGHDFVADLAGRAAAAVVEAWVDAPVPQCRVFSARGALAALARWNRERSPARVVGLTGSNGKTTVKEIISRILAQAGTTLATCGNYNNELGVPLTLSRLGSEHHYAVIEMGANKHGDVAHLAAIGRPHVGLITNAAAAHLEGFGSLAGVASAKGEMYSALPTDGVAVVNAEDQFADYWRSIIGDRRCLSFAAEGGSGDVIVSPEDEGLRLELPGRRLFTEFGLSGRHNRLNAAAAAAVAAALDVSDRAIEDGLANAQPVSGRLVERVTAAGGRLLDDSYNANPGSLDAGMAVLAERSGERCLVLGDMAELGSDSEAFHAEAGERAAAQGIERLLALGDQAARAAKAFGAGGEVFDDRDALVSRLGELDGPARVFLVKGSRSAAMDKVVGAIVTNAPAPGGENGYAATD